MKLFDWAALLLLLATGATWHGCHVAPRKVEKLGAVKLKKNGENI